MQVQFIMEAQEVDIMWLIQEEAMNGITFQILISSQHPSIV